MLRKQNDNQTRRHRLKGHDYSEPGYYFVTFATKDRLDLLGDIQTDVMTFSPTGRYIDDLLHILPSELPQMEIDCYAIMPNHLHLLIYLFIDVEDPLSISSIVRTIKGRAVAAHRSLSTDRTGLWQKGFHDEIVRDDKHLDQVRKYIADNPYCWKNSDS